LLTPSGSADRPYPRGGYLSFARGAGGRASAIGDIAPKDLSFKWDGVGGRRERATNWARDMPFAWASAVVVTRAKVARTFAARPDFLGFQLT